MLHNIEIILGFKSLVHVVRVDTDDFELDLHVIRTMIMGKRLYCSRTT